MKGYLVLEDGTLFEGKGFGAAAEMAGEVVFNTGMTGYQEVLTDPSYCGQIVTMTYPLIGNYGINAADSESRRPWVRGFVVKELCELPSHWQAATSLSDYLAENGIPGLAGIDTRALTRHLRRIGTLRGVIVTTREEEPPTAEQIAGWVEKAKSFEMHDHVMQVTTPEPVRLPGPGRRVAVLDLGLKETILKSLTERQCDVTVLPATATAEEILALNPEGLLLSGGPGDPNDLPDVVGTVARLVERGDMPILGIGMGHQVLSLALGAKVSKMKYGHRGVNHPVKDYTTGRILITAQNHGFAVDEATLPPGVMVTHRNLNDGTVEGIAHLTRPLLGVQYHPAASDGAQEGGSLLDRFLGVIESRLTQQPA